MNFRHSYGTRIYHIWCAMRQRCQNPKAQRYERYGGRGIKVCDRWQVFENFLADMGEAPTGLSLDRYPNNDGNYEPGNCRWATPREQALNRRSSRGEKHGLTVKAGIGAARARGVRLGRPRVHVDRSMIATLRTEGLSWAKIADRLGVGEATAFRAAS